MMAVDKQAMLAQAEEAYHSLMIGQGVAELQDQNGERIRYTQANKAGLYNYILQLRSELGLSTVGRPGKVWY
jgi:hypothetical protein